MRTSFTAISLALLLTAGSASATTVTINPSQDNTLCQYNAGSSSNGLGDIFTGRTGQTDNISRRRGVIAFDVAANVPAGATISSSKLRLYLNTAADSSSRTTTIYKATASWGEGTSFFNGGQCATATTNDATWVHRFYNTTSWTSSGGDYSGTSSASLGVGSTFQYYEWGSNSTMVSDAQGWLDTASTNYGYAIVGDESASATARRFTSGEGTSTQLPQLVITYTPKGAAPKFFWAKVAPPQDVTGDGIADTVWRNLETNELLLEINGGASAISFGALSPSSVTHGVRDLGAGPALIVHDSETLELTAIPLGKASARPVTLVTGGLGLRFVRFADTDGDGREDLIVRHEPTDQLYSAGVNAGRTGFVIKRALLPSGTDPAGI